MGKKRNNIPAYNGNRPYIYVSYSKKDAAKTIPLIQAMQNRGFRVWYDQDTDGENKNNKSSNQLKNCSAFLTFVSRNIMANEACVDEISFAKGNNKPSLMVLLEERVKFTDVLEKQTARFQKMRYMKPEYFVAELQKMPILAQCCGEDALEYYSELKKNADALRKEMKHTSVIKHKMIEQMEHFKITLENEELYRQSELLYAKWLFNKDGKVTMNTVDQAVTLCLRSAEMGNPKALVRLAYFYDKNYIALDGNDQTHFKIAYNYYTMVCFSGISEIEVRPGCPPIQWRSVREEAARAMLRMLSTAPSELQENPMYDYRTNYDRVQMEFGLNEEENQSIL